MTEIEFEDFLYSARKAKKEIDSLRKSYKDLDEEFKEMLSAGAMDYSKDRVQNSTPPDAMIAAAIDQYNDKRVKINTRIDKLLELINEVEAVIDKHTLGIVHEIMRLYFIEDKQMDEISKRLVYSQRHCWRLWREGKKSCYRGEQNEKKNL